MTRPVVALTGANGYVGSVITAALQGRADVFGLVRAPNGPDQIAWSFASDTAPVEVALRERGVTHLVHAAWDMTTNSLAELERSCVAGSRALFEAAERAGVGRIVFISTISAFQGAKSAYGRAKLQVEAMTARDTPARTGNVILRLGLLHGESDRGAYGNLRRMVRGSGMVPMIGRGAQPQYLLHERVLGQVIQRIVDGDFTGDASPITLADPVPVPFRDLLRQIARQEGRNPLLLPVPWPLMYAGIRTAETLGLRLGFRSDSVLSFVFQDERPDFGPLRRHGINTAVGASTPPGL